MAAPVNPFCLNLVNVARPVIECLAEPGLKAAFLFGSAAWGDADATSDLDLMLIVDRPRGYREVTRIRLADVLGAASRGGPDVADVDRVSWETFDEATAKGGWAYRILNSIILSDTDGYLEHLRDKMSADFKLPKAVESRFQERRRQAAAELANARAARQADDGVLALLHTRLAVQEAAEALLDFHNDRPSLTHFVDSVHHALTYLDQRELFERVQRALGLEVDQAAIQRSVSAYHLFTDTLREWVEQTSLGDTLSLEDRAWARLTYSPDVLEEITHKVDSFGKLGRIPSLQYYLDGKFLSPIRLSFGKVFNLKLTGIASRPSIEEFHQTLRQEPALFDAWVSALRLVASRSEIEDATGVVEKLIEAGDEALFGHGIVNVGVDQPGAKRPNALSFADRRIRGKKRGDPTR